MLGSVRVHLNEKNSIPGAGGVFLCRVPHMMHPSFGTFNVPTRSARALTDRTTRSLTNNSINSIPPTPQNPNYYFTVNRLRRKITKGAGPGGETPCTGRPSPGGLQAVLLRHRG